MKMYENAYNLPFSSECIISDFVCRDLVGLDFNEVVDSSVQKLVEEETPVLR